MSTRACVRCWEHKLQENFGSKQFKWSNDAPTCLDCAENARAEEYWEWKAQAQDRTCGVCANGLIAAQELRPGLEVRLRALVGSPELNGQYGRLLEYHEPTRSWPVLIATSNGARSLITKKFADACYSEAQCIWPFVEFLNSESNTAEEKFESNLAREDFVQDLLQRAGSCSKVSESSACRFGPTDVPLVLIFSHAVSTICSTSLQQTRISWPFVMRNKQKSRSLFQRRCFYVKALK